MTLISIYVKNYFKCVDPESTIMVYYEITGETIHQLKHNINNKSLFAKLNTKHIFIKRINIKTGKQEYVYSNFIPSDDLLIISKVRLPYNHKIIILYVVEDYIPNDYLIGNDFVIVNTVTECNGILSKIFKLTNTWLNRVYNNSRNCVVGIFDEPKIVENLKKDPKIPTRHIDSFYEEFVVCKVMIDMIRRKEINERIDGSLYNILLTFYDRLAIEVPDTIKEGRSGILDEEVINVLMNIDRFSYSYIGLDDILSVGVPKDVLKEAMYVGL